MGWGCSTVASNVLDVMVKPYRDESANGYKVKENVYFYEFGREQADGAIVGQVFKQLPEFKLDEQGREQHYVKRFGGLRIDADGTVRRFPGIPMARIREVNALKKNRFTGYVEGFDGRS